MKQLVFKCLWLLALLMGLMAASLHLGLRNYSPAQVWDAFQAGSDTGSLIIWGLRGPRTVVAAIAGGILGLSGLLMQAATRNPLAEPGLMGVNAGAAFAVVLLMVLTGSAGMVEISIAAFVGATAAVLLIFALSSLTGFGFAPAPVLLAGVTLTATLASFTQVLLLVDETALETVLFWLAGGFADRPISLVSGLAPGLFLAVLAFWMLAPALEGLAADDDSAHGLGINVATVRLFALALAAVFAGSAVTMAGPVSFIGLAAPHLARRLPGRTGLRGLIFVTLLVSAALAVAADILARVIVAPAEAPISTVLALVGVPVLIMLLRREKGEGV